MLKPIPANTGLSSAPLTDRILDLSKPRKLPKNDDDKNDKKFPKFVVENSPIDRFYKLYMVEPEDDFNTPRFHHNNNKRCLGTQHSVRTNFSPIKPGGSELSSNIREGRSISLEREKKALKILNQTKGL